jgi:hypothetical protein
VLAIDIRDSNRIINRCEAGGLPSSNWEKPRQGGSLALEVWNSSLFVSPSSDGAPTAGRLSIFVVRSLPGTLLVTNRHMKVISQVLFVLAVFEYKFRDLVT